MVKEAIDMFIEGELWDKAKKCASDMAPRYVNLYRLSTNIYIYWASRYQVICVIDCILVILIIDQSMVCVRIDLF